MIRRPTATNRAVPLLAMATAALLLGACQGTRAEQPPGWRTDGPPGWQVGNPVRETASAPPGAAGAAQSRADALAARLGLTGRALPGRRERDVRNERLVDEVTLANAAGERTAQLTFDAATGAPLVVARLDRPQGSDTSRLDARSAPRAARGFLQAAGLNVPAGDPQTRWDPGLGTWKVGWERTIDGIPAPGDGMFVDVLPGGQFAALAVVETPAATRPPAPISPDRAQEAAMAWATAHGLPSFPRFAVRAPFLEWRQANDFVDPAKPDSPEPLLRLVYSVSFSYLPQGEESPHLLVLYVDAGNGTLIGGAETA